MSIFRDLFAKNPIDAKLQAKVQEICGDVANQFTLNYTAAYKQVLIHQRQAQLRATEDKKCQQQQQEPHPSESDIAAAKELLGSSGLNDVPNADEYAIALALLLSGSSNNRSAHRPTTTTTTTTANTTNTTTTSSPITCKVFTSEVVNKEFDGYISYILSSASNHRAVLRSHRYSDFKNLDKELSRVKPAGAVLPAPSSKTGKRNLSDAFVGERVLKLQGYIGGVCADKRTAAAPGLRSFLGLSSPAGAPGEAALELAVAQTVRALGVPPVVAYGAAEDAIVRIAFKKVVKDLGAEITANCPTSEGGKKASLRSAAKFIGSVAVPLAAARWSGAEKNGEASAAAIAEVFDRNAEAYVAAREEVTKILSEKTEGAVPVEETAGTIAGLLDSIIGTNDDDRERELSEALAKALVLRTELVRLAKAEDTAGVMGLRDTAGEVFGKGLTTAVHNAVGNTAAAGFGKAVGALLGCFDGRAVVDVVAKFVASKKALVGAAGLPANEFEEKLNLCGTELAQEASAASNAFASNAKIAWWSLATENNADSDSDSLLSAQLRFKIR